MPEFAAVLLALTLCAAASSVQEERQVTSSPKNHMLDNNDNFSPGARFLCYDTRETVGPGIDNSQSIEKVEIETGIETVLYNPPSSIGTHAAPGVGAVSYSPVADEVVFIHGPLLEDVAVRGWYGKPNRNGASVPGDGSGKLTWVDKRDVDSSRPTAPGAHRGGTHRHEYSLDGSRIGFTYDDFLLTQFDRTIGYMEPHPNAPAPATHYFALLVPVVPKGAAKIGEIEKAAGDSWVGAEGVMRGFIGLVRDRDGDDGYTESLFVIDVPKTVDVTTAFAGSATEYPRPPQGVSIRRLTHTPAKGIVRGSMQGDRIAYYAEAPDGTTQVFIIPSDGSDTSDDPEKRPVQATFLEHGSASNVRWHPSGNAIISVSDGGIVATCVKPGPLFGKSVFLTPHGDGPERGDIVFSADGARIAYCRAVSTTDTNGNVVKTYDGKDFTQIFLIHYPDTNGDGIPDALVG
jgi:hypothetical protein